MNTGNLLQMQKEAAARVKQMEERSRRLVREHPVNLYRGVTLAPFLEQEQAPTQNAPEPPCRDPEPSAPCTSVCPTPKRATDLFCGDSEQVLLLLLAAVLWKNNAPIELVLVLLYIAL